MKKNVSSLDAIIKITAGFIGLSWGISRMVRAPYRNTPLIITMLSAFKIAEGITRWSPIFSLLKINAAKNEREN